MENNETAFPFIFTYPNGETEIQTGMDLRDYFANSACKSLIAKRDTSFIKGSINPKMPAVEIEYIATHSYQIADAMLKARKN